jgi:hypothetical protein
MKTIKHILKARGAIFLFIVLFASLETNAASYVWTGVTNTDWNTGTNWNVGAVQQSVPPTAADAASVPNTGSDPVLSANGVCLSLSISASASVTTGTHALTVSGSITGNGTLAAGTGIISVSGDITITSYTTTGNGSLILNGSNDQAINGYTLYDVEIGTRIDNTKAVNVTGAMSAHTMTFDAVGIMNLDGTAALRLTITGNIVLSSSTSDLNTLSSYITVAGNISGPGILDLTGNGQVSVQGDFSLDGLKPGTGGTSKVIFNGSSLQNVGNFNSTSTFNNIEIDNSVYFNDITVEVDKDMSGTGSLSLGNTDNAEVDLIGNMTGSFTISAGTGLFWLHGITTPQAQSITGQTFYDLKNNNQNTTLNGNVIVSHNLNLQAGDIILNGNNLTLNGGATSLQDNGVNISSSYTGNHGYIVTGGTVGNFKMNNGNAIFPIGHSTSHYNPIILSSTSTPCAVRVDETITDNTNTAVTDHVVQLTWQVTPTATQTMSETVQWLGSQELGSFDRTNSAISWRTATNQFWTKLGSFGNGSGLDPYSHASGATLSMTGGQLYYIAMGDNVSALPVILTAFNANYNNNQVNLDWHTASEINNDYFNIERSLDGSSWATIGKVQGHGNSMVINNYTAVDNLAGILPTNVIYYRLKQVDFNGESAYSMIKAVNLSAPSAAMSAFPNPAKDIMNITWNNAGNGTATLKIINLSGATIYTEIVSAEGAVQKQVNMSGFPVGTYIVQIVTDKNITSKAVYKN